ncbi:hypothetical protein FQR65_LT01193 [Abscondita terminalis]|nr:hypothetical protein FQR65_LT01193 [Abscondita terminalis]
MCKASINFRQLSNQFFKMFANAFQSGFISVFYSVGSNPLSIWDKYVKNGHIRRLVDEEVKSLVLEISGVNVATTYITCPVKPRASLGIKLPFLVMVVKNMKKYFSFEIQIADDKDMRRRFRVSNFQSTTKVRPFLTTMPIGLSSGWNQIQFNLADFTKRAYGSTYIETVRIQIHANVRLRRIYFSDRLYSDDELPNEFKLFLPAPGTHRRQPKTESDKRLSTEGIQVLEGEIPSVAPPATPCDEGSEEGYYEDVFGLGAPFSVRVEPPEPLDIDEDEDEDEGEGRAHLDEARLEELPVEKEPNEEERPAEAEDVEEPVATEAVAEGAPMTEEPPPTEESPPAEEAALEEAPPAEEQPPADETPQTEEPPPE